MDNFSPLLLTPLELLFAFDADAAFIAQESQDKEKIPFVAQLAQKARKHTIEEYLSIKTI